MAFTMAGFFLVLVCVGLASMAAVLPPQAGAWLLGLAFLALLGCITWEAQK